VRARSVVTVVCAVALLLPSAGAASAYVDVGTDPAGDDAGDLVIADIVWTKRSVWRNDDGDRWFRVALRTRRPIRDTNMDVLVRIDSRGDEHADVLMRIAMFEGKACYIGGGGGSERGRVRISDSFASCVVPLRSLEPGGKRIRWRLISQPHEGGPAYHVDLAPDRGWYR
jgi:hypothetical protein